MIIALNFAVSFIMSFVGSIPPGTINLITLQIGLEGKLKKAVRFAIAASLIEYPYAWLAVIFTEYILNNPSIETNIQLFAGIIMLSLGVINYLSARKSGPVKEKKSRGGFRDGLMLGILNPMALPYWVVVTGFLHSQGLIELSTSWALHAYLGGVTLGALSLLLLLAYLGSKVAANFKENTWLKRIPSIVLMVLGIIALVRFYLEHLGN